MSIFADVAIPVNVRDVYTYRIPAEMQESVVPGMRVYIPFSNRMAIGMVVHIHEKKPPFKVKPIRQLLDKEPVMSEEMLKLTEWIHSYYFASWGEVIQAALPAGMNFVSEVWLRAEIPVVPPDLKPLELELMEALVASENHQILMDEAERRWGNSLKSRMGPLRKRDLISIWEEPRLKVSKRMETYWYWESDGKSKAQQILTEYAEKKIPKWVEGISELLEMELPLPKKVITENELFSSYVTKRIRDEGIIEEREEAAREILPDLLHEPDEIKELNDNQEDAFREIKKAIDQNTYSSFLLFGVTGSGKTEVYIHALKKALEMGKGGLVLVPEIALTPQTMKRFYQIFGDQIAILHSRQNEKERYEAWQKLRTGEKRIAIGPRSAVFAPIQNLGIILVDEEHDTSYKQEDPSPRYHGRDVALMRAYLNDAVLVCGSATPSMNMLYLCTRKKATLLELPSRHATATLPKVNIIDLKQYKSAMRGPLAVPVFGAINEALEKNEQAIILFNRRGYASFLICESCGAIPECPHCSVSLKYHKKTRQLRCHYCGHSQRESNKCYACHKPDVTEMGSGTQRIEEEIQEIFSEARILRMDQDTTSGKDAHEKILSAFGRGDADILLGTQLVSKGLDFPNVTVVAVVNSDTELAFPSYRSSERMYQMLSQVSGRSGRGEKPGVVFLQTWKPEHPAFQYVRFHNFKDFAREELKFRKGLFYPPFAKLIKIVFRSMNEQTVGKVAGQMKHSVYKTYKDAVVLGPAPAAIYRMNNQFVWELFVKLQPDFNTKNMERFLEAVFTHYDQHKPTGASRVRINVHVDAM